MRTRKKIAKTEDKTHIKRRKKDPFRKSPTAKAAKNLQKEKGVRNPRQERGGGRQKRKKKRKIKNKKNPISTQRMRKISWIGLLF